MTPRPPRLSSPAKKDLPEEVYAAQKRAFEMGSLSTESFVPGQSGTRPNTPAEKAWSEYNHHWAGIISFGRFSRGSCANRENLLGAQLAAAFSGPFHFSFFEKRPGGLAARTKRLLGHVCGSRGLVAPRLCGGGRRPGRIRMAPADWPRRICQHPAGVSDAHRGLWRAVPHAFPQPRLCERRRSGRAKVTSRWRFSR